MNLAQLDDMCSLFKHTLPQALSDLRFSRHSIGSILLQASLEKKANISSQFENCASNDLSRHKCEEVRPDVDALDPAVQPAVMWDLPPPEPLVSSRGQAEPLEFSDLKFLGIIGLKMNPKWLPQCSP